MNVLFVSSIKDSFNPVKPIETQEHISMGISYISSFLKSNGHTTDLIVLTKKTKKETINKVIRGFFPHLICFTAVASEYGFIAESAKYIKSQYPEIFLLIGGVHASLNPDNVIRDSFDALCIGEGEHPTLELVEQLQKNQKPKNIPNLWIKNIDDIEKNAAREFIKNLDDLFFPDRDMWQKWISKPESKIAVLLSRGCLFQCTYCCNSSLRTLAKGEYVRLRSNEDILSEITQLSAKFSWLSEVHLEVETIGVNINFALELSARLEEYNKTRSKPLIFGLNLRVAPGVDYGNLFKAFKKANFNYIKVGLESGSRRIREEVLNRYYSNEDIIKVAEIAKSCGIGIYVFVMVGIPGETVFECRETVACLRRCQPLEGIFLSIFFPYEGTKLYDICQQKGLLKNRIDTSRERRIAVLDLPGFSKRQIQKEFDWFFYNVYRGHKSIVLLLAGVLRQRIGSSYIAFAVYRTLIAIKDSWRGLSL